MVVEILINLVNTFGYLGVFVATLVGNASIIFPTPTFIIIIASGAFLNPLLVGLIGGLGSAIGELTSYLAGLAGGKLAIRERKSLRKHFLKAEQWFEHHSPFFVIFIFSVLPLPFDIIGIISGAIKYDLKKFFLATLIGKIIKMTILALGGFYGIEVLFEYFS